MAVDGSARIAAVIRRLAGRAPLASLSRTSLRSAEYRAKDVRGRAFEQGCRVRRRVLQIHRPIADREVARHALVERQVGAMADGTDQGDAGDAKLFAESRDADRRLAGDALG